MVHLTMVIGGLIAASSADGSQGLDTRAARGAKGNGTLFPTSPDLSAHVCIELWTHRNAQTTEGVDEILAAAFA